MSGGHFNHNNYIYYQVYQFADELEHEINNNETKNEWGYAPCFNEETLDYLRQKVIELRKISEEMRHIDYLYSENILKYKDNNISVASRWAINTEFYLECLQKSNIGIYITYMPSNYNEIQISSFIFQNFGFWTIKRKMKSIGINIDKQTLLKRIKQIRHGQQ